MVEYRVGLKYLYVFLVFLHEPSLIIALPTYDYIQGISIAP